MSSTGTGSSSLCKIELVEIIWTKVILSWIKHCLPQRQVTNELSQAALFQILSKYKDDVQMGVTSKSLLADYNMTAFIQCQYPMLRLKETKKKKRYMYILSSVILYYCCTKSRAGAVDRDISMMTRMEQEAILIFCERLIECEVTVSNVLLCIRAACEKFYETMKKRAATLQQPIVDCLYKHEIIIHKESSIEFHSEGNSMLKQFLSKVMVYPSMIMKKNQGLDCHTPEEEGESEGDSSSSDCTSSETRVKFVNKPVIIGDSCQCVTGVRQESKLQHVTSTELRDTAFSRGDDKKCDRICDDGPEGVFYSSPIRKTKKFGG